MSSIKKYLEEKAYKSKMAEGDKKDDGMGVDEIDTDDYILDKNGKKHKAHKIVFNKGEDDGKQIGEELKGKQHKLDKNKNGKVDAHDFKLLRKEESVEEAKFDALKHVKNPSPAVKAAAKDVKRGSYADRAALMKAGGVKDDRGPRGVTQESMTDAQMNKREDLVKGMKKNFKSFVDKYGKDRAENVMYATATKNAMKEEIEQIDELSKDTLKRYSDAAHKDFSKNFQHDQNFTGIHSAIRTAMAKTNSGTGGVHSLKGTNKNPLHKHDGVQAGLKTAADAVTAARAPFKHKMKVRNQGMDRADARLHKEETTQIDEASPTFNAIRANTLTRATNSGKRSEQGAQAQHDRMQSAADHHHDTMRAYADASLDNHKHNHEQQKKEREAEVNHKIELMKIEREKRAEKPASDPHFDAMHKILRDRTARYKRSTQKEEVEFAEGFRDAVLITTAKNMDDNDVHITALRKAGLHASQGAGAGNHIIVPPEHAKKARELLSKHLKENAENIDEKITIDSKGNRIDNRVQFVPHPLASKTPDAIRRAYYAKLKAEKDKKKQEAPVKESVFDWKNKARQTSDSSKTKTYHDVKKVSTGTVYTKQFDKDGISKGTGDDAAKKAVGAEKRGRGRPKKDKFAEAVEFLMDLTEEQFDSVVEEGFDSFVESFLDEGKTGYAPGWMIKADPELKKKIDANKAKQKAMRQALGNPAAGKSTPANK